VSGKGAPGLQVPGADHVRVGVVAARWHAEVTDALLAGARTALDEMGVRDRVEVRAPGAFEVPVLAAALARNGCEAVVCLAVVIRGATPHFDYVCRAVTDGCARVALDTGVPVGFGVLTCDDEDQARDRAGLPGSREDKGREAATAAVAAATELRRLRNRAG
jgi:6,7-dimethyl-8-ribityllumazine synthase